MLFWHILTHRLLCMHDDCPIQFLSRRFSASPAHLADYVHMELLHGRHRMEADAEWCNCSPGFVSDPCVCHVLQRLTTSHKRQRRQLCHTIAETRAAATRPQGLWNTQVLLMKQPTFMCSSSGTCSWRRASMMSSPAQDSHSVANDAAKLK